MTDTAKTPERVKHDSLVEALAAAKQEFGKVRKDKTAEGKTFNYKYNDISDVIEAVDPALSRHGLVQLQLMDIRDGQQLLVSQLRWRDEAVESRMILPIEGLAPQEVGKVVTYYRRHALQAMLGIAAERDDDAANTADVRHPAARGGPQYRSQDRHQGPARAPAPPAPRQQQANGNGGPKPTTDGRGWSVTLPGGEVVGPFATPTDAARKLWIEMKGTPDADGMNAAEIQEAMDANRAVIDAAPENVAREIVKLLGERAPKAGAAA